MKKILIIAVVVLMAGLTGCKKDSSSTAPTTTDPIVGTWLSTGTNVAYGLRLAPFKVKSITATFNANGSYTVVQTDSSNVITNFTGTYVNPASTNTDTTTTSLTHGATIHNIVASQATPTTVTATGIYAITDVNMTYEVIQTSPVLAGVLAPTAAGGFGSTTIGGVKYAIYVQKYVKQ
jgi:hypothetical protein